MRVSGRNTRILGISQVKTKIGSDVSQVSSPKERGLCWNRDRLVSPGHQKQDRSGGHARKRRFPQMGGVGGRISWLVDPNFIVKYPLDIHGPGYIVDQRMQIPQRLVLLEVGDCCWKASNLGDTR